MYARVATLEGGGSDEDMVQAFQQFTDPLQRMDGFRTAYLLVDPNGGRGMTVTLWETEEALRASAERAAEMREQAGRQLGATPGEAVHYRVGLELG